MKAFSRPITSNVGNSARINDNSICVVGLDDTANVLPVVMSLYCSDLKYP
jgi:hypothetical protein